MWLRIEVIAPKTTATATNARIMAHHDVPDSSPSVANRNAANPRDGTGARIKMNKPSLHRLGEAAGSVPHSGHLSGVARRS